MTWVSELKTRLIDRLLPAQVDQATFALAVALVECAMDITHENGTIEGTEDAVWSTIQQFLKEATR